MLPHQEGVSESLKRGGGTHLDSSTQPIVNAPVCLICTQFTIGRVESSTSDKGIVSTTRKGERGS